MLESFDVNLIVLNKLYALKLSAEKIFYSLKRRHGYLNNVNDNPI